MERKVDLRVLSGWVLLPLPPPNVMHSLFAPFLPPPLLEATIKERENNADNNNNDIISLTEPQTCLSHLVVDQLKCWKNQNPAGPTAAARGELLALVPLR